MKKLFIVLLGSFLFLSCSNGLEDKAKNQLKKTMKELLKNPDSATLSNVKSILNNDSLCIIHFNCKAQNGFGGFTSSKYEYVFIKSDVDGETSYNEMVIDLDDEESIIEKSNDLLDEVNKKTGNDKRKKNAQELEKDSINHIYFTASFHSIFKGRKVEANEGEEIKL